MIGPSSIAPAVHMMEAVEKAIDISSVVTSIASHRSGIEGPPRDKVKPWKQCCHVL